MKDLKTPTTKCQRCGFNPDAPADGAHCSFCGRGPNEVKRLIAGPMVFICDECIEICLNALSGLNPEGVKARAPEPTAPAWPKVRTYPYTSKTHGEEFVIGGDIMTVEGKREWVALTRPQAQAMADWCNNRGKWLELREAAKFIIDLFDSGLDPMVFLSQVSSSGELVRNALAKVMKEGE